MKSVKEQQYLSKGQLYILKVIADEIYELVNVATKKQVRVSKAELIKNIQSGVVLVSNIYLRKTPKGGVSIVCKEPEKIKRIVHYKGELGDFWYDTKEFELINTKALGWKYSHICLHYKGEKIRGIEIPKGIINCECMFDNCNDLREVPIIPEGVTNCKNMFYSCSRLEKAPKIPQGVTNCFCMFCGCSNLVEVSIIPSGVTDCGFMFKDCTSLVKAPKIPEGVTNCEWMFDGCESLVQAPKIPQGVTNCFTMFGSCESLKEAPAIPSSVTEFGYMFGGCSEEVQKQGEYNIKHKVSKF